jgi:hypothetical protein
VFACQGIGYLLEATIEHRATGRIATVRLRRDDDSPFVDLLFATCGIEREITKAARPLVVRGERVPVATTGHLIAMKLVSRDDKRRPRDRQDLVNLAMVADATEWHRAETAVELIVERGFARKRDLRKALSELRERARPTSAPARRRK